MMKPNMNRIASHIPRWTCSALLALIALVAPITAQAGSNDGERVVVDARLEGYPSGVTLDPSSTALTWLFLCVLGAVCLGVMFINPKRSHLD